MPAQRHHRGLGQLSSLLQCCSILCTLPHRPYCLLLYALHTCPVLDNVAELVPLCCSNASVHPFTPVTGASAWYADQYKHNNEYIYDLSAEDLAELDAAVAAVVKSGKDLQVIAVFHS